MRGLDVDAENVLGTGPDVVSLVIPSITPLPPTPGFGLRGFTIKCTRIDFPPRACFHGLIDVCPQTPMACRGWRIVNICSYMSMSAACFKLEPISAVAHVRPSGF